MSPRAGNHKHFLPVFLFFAALWAVFQFAFPYHLAFKERYVLFLSDASWLSPYFKKPAPLSFIAGDWLSQFFLIPGLPALLTTLLLLLLWDALRRVNARAGVPKAALWSLLPTAGFAWLILYPEIPLAVLTAACAFAWLSALVSRIRPKAVRYAGFILLLALLIPTVHSLIPTAPLSKLSSEREYDYRIHFMASAGRWDRVEKMGLRNPHESLVTAYYYNLSQARAGKLPDGLLKAYQPTWHGLFIPVREGVECFRLMASTEALYLAGDYAQAQHSAMLGMTFSPRQRSAAMVKALSDIAFANGDYDTARRYLKMLEKTACYKRWAQDGLRLLAEESSRLRIRNDCRDILVQHNDYRTSLANIAATSSDGKIAADYLLCLDLLDKNLENFRKDYDTLYKEKYKFAAVPMLYQQALLMTFDPDTSPARQLTEYGIERAALDGIAEFLKGNENLFRTSYWFYYKYAQPGQ